MKGAGCDEEHEERVVGGKHLASADLLPGLSFHLFTSESRHRETSLHLQHGDNAHTWGYCKDYKRAVCRAPSGTGENSDNIQR